MPPEPHDSPAAEPDFHEGLDRKRLKDLLKDFQDLNHARLERTRDALPSRHLAFLDYLPMLFHVNHPMLPGYISHQVPCGLHAYKPSREDIGKVQRLARSFTYHRQPMMQDRIHSLFLMGSSGSIAHSGGSDLDIWVCHDPAITAIDRQLLQQKAEQISSWAASIGLEAHFFLMEGEQFRRGQRQQLGGEDCGSTQHYLLLDEFYRTGLLLAGRPPIWWLVPPEHDQLHDEFAGILRDKRYIPGDLTIDFGSVGKIPAGEFIGAGIWQLYKAIDSPYKSVLKLLLTEAYAAEYPQVKPLSLQFKQAVYDQQFDIDELDPYVMIYRRLEHYLTARREFKRLELVRRCFYFKTDLRLSSPTRHNNWQRQLMERMISEWGWSKAHLANLDTRRHWKVGKVVEEQKALVRELTNGYRFLQDFAQRSQASALINSEEMSVLGRKLYAAFERKAGKVEWINPGIADDLSEEYLYFSADEPSSNDRTVWRIYRERPGRRHNSLCLKQADSLLAILAWCHFNGISDRYTRFKVSPGRHQVNEFELHNIAVKLSQQLPQAKQYQEHSDELHQRFKQANRIQSILLFINVGVDPMAEMRKQGVVRLSNFTDSLGYSGLRENLVINIEQAAVNSWGEISTNSYQGNNALIHCLRDYLQMIPPGSKQALPQLEIACFCPERAEAIRQRVETLFRDVIAFYYSGTRPANSRYILEIQRQFYVLQFHDNRPSFECAGGFLGLLHHLSQPQSHYSPIELDRFCLKKSVLSAIQQVASPDSIQVFYQLKGKDADVYIHDEKGSLCHFSTAFHSEEALLLPLQQFLQATLFRRQSESSDLLQGFNNAVLSLSYYRLQNLAGKPTAVRFEFKSAEDQQPALQRYFFNVQAIAEQDQSGKIQFSIYCDHQAFTPLEYGEDLYRAVARFILSRRRMQQRYPCFITDLDLSRCSDLRSEHAIQTAHYLRYKHKLERALNQAIKKVSLF
jgi:adenylate cyclase class 1